MTLIILHNIGTTSYERKMTLCAYWECLHYTQCELKKIDFKKTSQNVDKHFSLYERVFTAHQSVLGIKIGIPILF